MMRPWAKLVISLVLWLPLAAWQAYAVSVLWGWFVEPEWGVESPGIWTLAGLTMLVSVVRARPHKGDEDEDQVVSIGVGIVVPAVSIAFGWVYHLLAVSA